MKYLFFKGSNKQKMKTKEQQPNKTDLRHYGNTESKNKAIISILAKTLKPRKSVIDPKM